jgi:hypothetical protein
MLATAPEFAVNGWRARDAYHGDKKDVVTSKCVSLGSGHIWRLPSASYLQRDSLASILRFDNLFIYYTVKAGFLRWEMQCLDLQCESRLEL